MVKGMSPSPRPDLHTAQWKATRKRILARDGHQCTQCGATEDLTVDHIEPMALAQDADSYTDADLITLCRKCNGLKSDRVAQRLDYRAPGWF